MAGKTSVWGIDLGQCALKALKLTYDSKQDKAIAEAFDFIEHAKILSQPDADPDELIRSAIEKFLSRNDVKGCKVNVSIPGQAGLARFVQLPPVEAKKVPEIVAFEAKQQIPFPLEECTWDWQRLGTAQEEEGFVLEAEVGIFAIKRDMILRHLSPFLNAGIELDIVQMAPLAVYNFTAFDQFYHGQKKAEGAEGEPVPAPEERDEPAGDTIVVLDMGADKTDVIITDGDAIWNRNLPIGGNHFTRALTKDLKLTFAKAEHLKRNATKAADPKKLYQAMRPVFQDFVSELQRSIGYFQNTHKDREIREILGAGNGFKLPGLQKFLQQNFEYKVRKVSDFKGIKGDEILAERSFSENMLGFCVAYGLALQGLGQTPLQTNLLPQEIRTARLIKQKKPWSLTAAAALLLGCSSLFIGNYRVYSAVNSATFKGPSENAKAKTLAIQKIATEFEGAKGKFKATTEAGEKLMGYAEFQKRLGWIQVLKAINDAVPRRAQKIDESNIDSAQEINIEQIDAIFLTDLSTWDADYPDFALTTLDAQDKEKKPSGEGWVFQVIGHTYHKDHEIYVYEHVLKGFQHEKLRQVGITHALLYGTAVDEQWTPRKGSAKAFKKLEPVVKVAAATGAGSGGSGSSASQSAASFPGAGGSSDMMGGMGGGGGNEMFEQMVPEDVQGMFNRRMGPGGMGMGAGQQDPQDVATLLRTDFAIRFVWIPDSPKKSEGN